MLTSAVKTEELTPKSISPEQLLWQTVLLSQIEDALYEGPDHRRTLDQYNAHSWLLDKRQDFRDVCLMAGLCPEFVSDSYRAGRIDIKILKKASETRREVVSAW